MVGRVRALRRVARGARAAAARIRALIAGRPVPTVSVVVPFFDVEEYLGSTIDSLVAQTLGAIEIILVDDGSTDGSLAVARRKALLDHRIRIVRQRNAGPGPARELGISVATGKYLAFVDSDDVLPPDALALLVAAAERTGSDIAVGAFRRFTSTSVWVADWVGDVHRAPRSGTLADFPELLRNNYPPGKVYRRSFWEAQGLRFRSGAIYEDQPLIAQLLLAAKRIAVIPEIVYDYRARDDRSSISQRPENPQDLHDRVLAWRLTREALEAADAPPAVVEAWYGTVFGTHLHWYLDNDAITDDAYWSTLRAAYADLAATAPPAAWAGVGAERRAAMRLLRDDRRDRLEQLREAGLYREPERFFEAADADGLRYAFDDEVPAAERRSEPPAVRVAQRLDGAELRVGDDAVAVSLAGRAWLRGTPAESAAPPDVVLCDEDGRIVERARVEAAADGGFIASFEIDTTQAARYRLLATIRVGDYRTETLLGHAALEWLGAASIEYPTARGRLVIAADPNPHVPIVIAVEA